MRFTTVLYTTAIATLSLPATALSQVKPPPPPPATKTAPTTSTTTKAPAPAPTTTKAATTAPAKPAAVRQSANASIDAGMSKAQVIEHFGKPAAERTRGEFTYLFFSNGMEKSVGTSDVVTLQNDKVVDAVLRSPHRAYSGTSSSPKAISAQEAKKANPQGTVLKKGGE